MSTALTQFPQHRASGYASFWQIRYLLLPLESWRWRFFHQTQLNYGTFSCSVKLLQTTCEFGSGWSVPKVQRYHHHWCFPGFVPFTAVAFLFPQRLPSVSHIQIINTDNICLLRLPVLIMTPLAIHWLAAAYCCCLFPYLSFPGFLAPVLAVSAVLLQQLLYLMCFCWKPQLPQSNESI